MKRRLWAAAAFSLVMPGIATAFPIAAGAVGVGLLGIFAFPLALLLGAGYWCYSKSRKSAGPLAVLISLVFMAMFYYQDIATEQLNKAALFTSANVKFLSPDIPFPFMDPEEQAQSLQAVSAEEFAKGIEAGHFSALKLSTYPNLFTDSGSISAESIWQDKDLLISAVNRLGGRVVLVDQFGGIAGSVASAAMANFGLNIGFLKGGTTELSKYGWSLVDRGTALGGKVVPVNAYRDWIKAHPDAYVIGVTTDSEFVRDGWLFGNQTLSLADFLANFDGLRLKLLGKQVFIVGFETNDTGATPVIVSLLSREGIDVHYVMPNPDEILIKPAYFDPYLNDSRAVSLEDVERFILTRPDIQFLDFSETPWAVGQAMLKDRYHFLPMEEVGKGGMSQFLGTLDKSKTYIGLAFDRRTAYHSLLAGQYLANHGSAWLGRFTQASSLTEQYFRVDDLDTFEEHVLYQSRYSMAVVGYAMLGNGPLLATAFGLLAGLASLLIKRKMPLRSALVFASLVLVYVAALQAKGDYPQVEQAYLYFQIGAFLALLLAMAVFRLNATPRVRAISSHTPVLPPKAALLNLARSRGFTIVSGIVARPLDLPRLSNIKLGAQSYIVRSAADDEAASHESTAGLYESYVCAPQAVGEAASTIFTSFTKHGVDGCVLIQPYLLAEWYGVIQLQDNAKSHLVACDIGFADSVTSGRGSDHSYEIPIWDLRKAPPLIRKAALAFDELLNDGVCSIEFALSRTGQLTILQVNQQKSRACAGLRLKKASNKQVVQIATSHPDALSAAVVAALAPGHIIAFGGRRFALMQSAWRTKAIHSQDCQALGFNPKGATIEHLVSWVDRLARSPVITSPCRPGCEAVAEALQEVAQTVGRMNRIASYRLMQGDTGSWEGEPRPLPSSQLGAALAEGQIPTWLGLPVEPLSAYSASESDQRFDEELWPSQLLMASSPAEWLKDATSVLLAARLAALAPAIQSLCGDGQGDRLMHAIFTQHGDWSALTSAAQESQLNQPVLLRDAAGGSVPTRGVWRLPPAGIAGVAISPTESVALGVLVIEDCNMSYLPALDRATAVIAGRGSITSHLMQHASAKGLPVVIGVPIPNWLQPGARVHVSPEGIVTYA